MATAKIAISLDEGTVKRLDRLVKSRIFPSRSKVIQDAVEEKPVLFPSTDSGRRLERLNQKNSISLLRALKKFWATKKCNIG